MHFDIFSKRADAHLRTVQEYLQEANLKRIEHQIAAEHHAALALMYTQRVTWLEQEMTHPRADWPVAGSVMARQVEPPKRGPASILNWPRPHGLETGSLPESA
ncbi:MAG: hypothetical protein JWP47_2435 [Polaromonas sp.]|jgi:hypothetical protein|nr:hypothetical protein [Polaromonas sp.]